MGRAFRPCSRKGPLLVGQYIKCRSHRMSQWSTRRFRNNSKSKLMTGTVGFPFERTVSINDALTSVLPSSTTAVAVVPSRADKSVIPLTIRFPEHCNGQGSAKPSFLFRQLCNAKHVRMVCSTSSKLRWRKPRFRY